MESKILEDMVTMKMQLEEMQKEQKELHERLRYMERRENRLCILALPGIEDFAYKVYNHLRIMPNITDIEYADVRVEDFASGEKITHIPISIRGSQTWVFCDPLNYSVKYKLHKKKIECTPAEHFDLARSTASADRGISGKIHLVMPFLVNGRQHRISARHSLDAQRTLIESEDAGFETFLTQECHDPTMQAAMRRPSIFENIYPTYRLFKAFIDEEEIGIDNEVTAASLDLGGGKVARNTARILRTNVVLFDKNRTGNVVDGVNLIENHTYIGGDITGHDIVIRDDMISSGGSLFEAIDDFKARGARNIYVLVSFFLATSGIEKFRQYVEEGKLTRVYTTNSTYVPKKYLKEDWLRFVDVSPHYADVIHVMHTNGSLEPHLDKRADTGHYADKIREERIKARVLKKQ